MSTLRGWWGGTWGQMIAGTGLALTVGACVFATTAGCASSVTEPLSAGGDEQSEAGTPGPQGDFGKHDADAGAGDGATAHECTKMDIVFVVDDSGSMDQEQSNLASNFPKFANVIDQYKTKSGESLDYRVAVTTTRRTNTQGTFVTKRGFGAPTSCAPGPNRPWLERTDGNVADMFACRAQVGTEGGSPERSLESAFLAITDRIDDGTNTSAGAGFLRDDALLAFVAITDEDEGGTEANPAREMKKYPSLFDAVKGGRERWAAAVIAGEVQCSSKGFGEAAEATRLKRFITEVGKNGVFSSICSGDLTDGLAKALETFGAACKTFPPGPR